MPIKLGELYFFCLICYIEELKRRGLTYIKEAIMINKNNSKQNYTVKKSNNIKELSNNEEKKIVAQHNILLSGMRERQ